MTRLLFLISLFSLVPPVSSAQTNTPPNIILIMADDLGYGDVGAYGQTKIRTPNLDRMAREGVRFTQFYAGNTVCAPSRDALMTGRHTGHTFVRGNVGWARGDAPLPDADVTIAEALDPAGYTSGVFGKWSLGLYNTTGAPHRQGFDAFLGYEDQTEAHFYYVDQLQTIRDGETVNLPVDSTAYSHDLIVNAALDFVRTHQDNPFFVYLPVTIPHAELIVPESSLQEYLNEDGTSVFVPESQFPGNRQYPPLDKPRAIYAAMVTHLDRSVGQVLDLIRELELEGETLVLFTSDNGPHTEGGLEDPEFFDSNGPLRGHKRDFYEGGIRVPMVAWGPGIVPEGTTSDHVWAAWDLLPTLTDLAGVSAPSGIDGRSMAPLLTGSGTAPEHDYLYWELFRGDQQAFTQAIRRGDWKALRIFSEDGSSATELYNLADDLGETRNLAAEHPDRVAELEALMTEAHEPAELEDFRRREPAALQ